MSFLKAGDNLGSHPGDKRKGTWSFTAFQLHPAPGRQTEIMITGETVPDLHARDAFCLPLGEIEESIRLLVTWSPITCHLSLPISIC